MIARHAAVEHPELEGTVHHHNSELIWEHDTPEPGVTPLKWKLSIPEAANQNICQGSS